MFIQTYQLCSMSVCPLAVSEASTKLSGVINKPWIGVLTIVVLHVWQSQFVFIKFLRFIRIAVCADGYQLDVRIFLMDSATTHLLLATLPGTPFVAAVNVIHSYREGQCVEHVLLFVVHVIFHVLSASSSTAPVDNGSNFSETKLSAVSNTTVFTLRLSITKFTHGHQVDLVVNKGARLILARVQPPILPSHGPSASAEVHSSRVFVTKLTFLETLLC